MKCQNCGANLTIDDEVCSFCGAANPFAAKHRREMRHFTREFNRTKSDVLTKSRHHSKWAAKITLIAVMVALNMLVWFLIANSYEVEAFMIGRNIDANYLVHKARLDEYEADRDFIGLNTYYEQNQLYYSDSLDEYEAVRNVCSNFSYLYEYVMELVTEEDFEYYTKEQRLESIVELMDYIYEYSKPREYDNPDRYNAQHQECMNDIVALMEDLIQTYMNISDEDMEGFWELSKARRQILLEEGLGINE